MCYVTGSQTTAREGEKIQRETLAYAIMQSSECRREQMKTLALTQATKYQEELLNIRKRKMFFPEHKKLLVYC